MRQEGDGSEELLDLGLWHLKGRDLVFVAGGRVEEWERKVEATAGSSCVGGALREGRSARRPAPRSGCMMA